MIRAYFGEGDRWEVEITYSKETHALGTAGPLGLIENLDENFLVMNGDILTDIDFDDLWRRHLESGAIATIATCTKLVPISLGVLELAPNGDLSGYTEKPTLEYRVSMGMYVFHRRIKSYIPTGQRLDLPDLMKDLIDKGEKVFCYEFQGRWLDIGNPEDYARANEDFVAKD